MYVITFTAILALLRGFWFPTIGRKFLFSPAYGFSRHLILIALLFLSVSLAPDHVFAQSKKSKEKLGLVKVKSQSFKRKKQRETSTFTSKGFDNNTPGGSASNRQKMASFVGNGVPITKLRNNTSNPKDAAAYRHIKALKPGRNPMGEQIARKSNAYRGSGIRTGMVKSDYKMRKDARKKNKKISKYRGDLIIKKIPKGAHPSAAWRGGKVKNSYQQKEKYRQRMMKRIGRNKNKMQPNYLRKKNRDEKPTYDSRESEIWLKPR
jgi:hypothetical protein